MSETPLFEVRSQVFPTIRIGGLFVCLVGVAVLVSTFVAGHNLISGPLFFAGFGIAIGGVLLNRSLRARLASGDLSVKQRTVLRGTLIWRRRLSLEYRC